MSTQQRAEQGGWIDPIGETNAGDDWLTVYDLRRAERNDTLAPADAFLKTSAGASAEIPVTSGEDEEMNAVAARAGRFDPPRPLDSEVDALLKAQGLTREQLEGSDVSVDEAVGRIGRIAEQVLNGTPLAEAEQAFNDRAKKLKDAEFLYAEIDGVYNEIVKPILDERRAAFATLAELAGVGHAFQDRDGIVYQIAEKKGTFVEFTPFEIKRTQRIYAEGGSHVLARKTAEELGFAPFKPEKEVVEEVF